MVKGIIFLSPVKEKDFPCLCIDINYIYTHYRHRITKSNGKNGIENSDLLEIIHNDNKAIISIRNVQDLTQRWDRTSTINIETLYVIRIGRNALVFNLLPLLGSTQTVLNSKHILKNR